MTDENPSTVSSTLSIDKDSPESTKSDAKSPTLTSSSYRREIDRDERKLRHWIVRVIVSTMAFAFIVVVITMSYMFIVKGTNFDGSVLDKFLKAFSDVVDILK